MINQVNYIIKAAERINLQLENHQAEKLIQYMQGLLKANEAINVTRITDEHEFIEKHLLDSLTCLPYIKDGTTNILDVGTGGGFPGVPLAIMLPECEVTLLDATEKKLKVISDLCASIGINNVKTLHARAEALGKTKDYREQYDIVVSRAVANLTTLSELCIPFVKTNGAFLAMKGRSYQEEVDEAEVAIKTLGGKIKEIASCLLLQSDLVHVIIVIGKFKQTPPRFPRSFSKIKKEGFPQPAGKK